MGKFHASITILMISIYFLYVIYSILMVQPSAYAFNKLGILVTIFLVASLIFNIVYLIKLKEMNRKLLLLTYFKLTGRILLMVAVAMYAILIEGGIHGVGYFYLGLFLLYQIPSLFTFIFFTVKLRKHIN